MILAIDTGTATLGWSRVSRRGVVDNLGALLQPLHKGERAHDGYERRCARQVDELEPLLDGVTLLVGEALSFARSAKAVASVSVCWGMLVTMARLKRIPLWRVPPKRWQHALLGTPAREAVDYPVLTHRLREHITRTGTPRARSAVAALSATAAPHALDAAGIGIYTATIAHVEAHA